MSLTHQKVKQNTFCVKSEFYDVTEEFHYGLMSF